jgi:hypothetical protein
MERIRAELSEGLTDSLEKERAASGVDLKRLLRMLDYYRCCFVRLYAYRCQFAYLLCFRAFPPRMQSF